MAIEGFDDIFSTLMLAKKLNDIGKGDIVKKNFADELCWDNHWENIMATMFSLFPKFKMTCDGYETEEMTFGGGPIAEYFAHARKQDRKRGQRHAKKPFIMQANEAVGRWLNFSHCLDWKLSGKTGSKKAANASKLTIHVCTSCGCNALDGAAFGIVEIYKWFSEKCNEFKKQKPARGKTRRRIPLGQRKKL